MVPVAQGNKGLTVCIWPQSRARTGQWYTVQTAQPHRGTQVPKRIVHIVPLLSLSSPSPSRSSTFPEWLLTPDGGDSGLVSRARSFGFKELSSSNHQEVYYRKPSQVQPASRGQTGRPSGRELSASLRPRRLSSPTDCPLSATSFCAH